MQELKIKRAWLSKSDLRFDASYHLGDGPFTKLKFKKSPYEISTLSKETKEIFKGNIFKRVHVNDPKKGYRFMTASDMMKSDINNDRFVSKKYTSTQNLLLKKDWILVTRSGTLGKTVYTNDNFEGILGSDDLIRIIPNNKRILGGFMYAFLSSKFGYGLLIQSGYGGVIQHIEPHHLSDLPIPLFPDNKQQEIHNLIIETSELRVDADKLLKKAVEYFENIIGESEIHLNFQTGKISSQSLKTFHKRFDSQYQLLWKDLFKEQKKKLHYEKIWSFAKNIYVGGRSKRIYVENGIPFLSSSEMMLYNPKRSCKKVSKKTPNLSSMLVSKKDILISRSGTVGNTILVGDDLNGAAISEHALRLVINSKKLSPNYVFCFLKTKFGMKSMEASSFGSVIITLNEDLVGNINIPILPVEEQNVINDIVDLYLEKMDKSLIKENMAIDKIEKEIESWQES